MEILSLSYRTAHLECVKRTSKKGQNNTRALAEAILLHHRESMMDCRSIYRRTPNLEIVVLEVFNYVNITKPLNLSCSVLAI